jgi:DNA-binding transcriptional LysR family regulator
MGLDRLQSMAVFVRVAELGSFSSAALQLGLSKSAVSKHVTALEERLGVRLINRTTRRLALTEAGSVFRDYCARIAQDVEEAELSAMQHGTLPRGRLKLNAPMTFGFLHLGPLLPEFLARHPGIEVELTLNDRFVDLLEEGYDVAVRIGRLADSSLIARRLATTRFVCAASPAYLARAGAPCQPTDLTGHNCLRYSLHRQPDDWAFGRGAEHVSVRIKGNLKANNGDALRSAALEGLGIVYIPDFIVGDDLERGLLVPLLPDWQTPEIPIHAVFPPQRHASAKLRVFVDYLVEKFGRREGWGSFCRRAERAAAAGR